MELLTKASYDSAPNQREIDNLKVAYEAACKSIVLLGHSEGCQIRQDPSQGCAPLLRQCGEGGLRKRNAKRIHFQ